MERKNSEKFNLLEKLFGGRFFKTSDLSFEEWEKMENKELAMRNLREHARNEKVH